MALASKTNVHGPASYMMNTGFLLPGFPCMGAWLSYGLGSLCATTCRRSWSCPTRGPALQRQGELHVGFLPMRTRGRSSTPASPTPIPDLFPPDVGAVHHRRQPSATAWSCSPGMNRRHADAQPGRLAARGADRLVRAGRPDAAQRPRGARPAPARREPTRRLYGLDDPVDRGLRPPLPARPPPARARRPVRPGLERRGRADEQLGQPQRHPHRAARRSPAPSTSPIAGLLRDLKARGLLDDTLVVWSTEFGRMPFTQGATGRDHNGGTSVAWLAGAGVKGGRRPRPERRLGLAGRRGRRPTATTCTPRSCTCSASTTTRLTFRHNGIDRRLTDVHGHVINEVLA